MDTHTHTQKPEHTRTGIYICVYMLVYLCVHALYVCVNMDVQGLIYYIACHAIDKCHDFKIFISRLP